MSEKKKYFVKAIVKFIEDVGEVEASSPEEVYDAVQDVHRYSLISRKYPGGVYDLDIKELS